MGNKTKKAKYEYRDIKVKPETYKRLRVYQARMVLQSNGEEKYSMDQVIGALLNFLETTDIKIEPS